MGDAVNGGLSAGLSPRLLSPPDAALVPGLLMGSPEPWGWAEWKGTGREARFPSSSSPWPVGEGRWAVLLQDLPRHPLLCTVLTGALGLTSTLG